MKIFSTVHQIQSWRRTLTANKSVGFVPTMGALHEGHLSLVQRSKKENDITIVSIFVNPTQFGPKEDFKKYPRPWKNDRSLLKKMDVDFLFSPKSDSMYSPDNSTVVEVKSLNNVLCGSPHSRGPGHFNGVSTVVAKLFNVVRPSRAYFGMKDFQQVRVIEQLVQDLNFDVHLVRCDTVREKDGLAMSSRNRYLSPDERRIAPQFFMALQYGRKLLTSSRIMSAKKILSIIRADLNRMPMTTIDYVELVDPQTLKTKNHVRRPVLIAAAIRLGKTRLIDNLLVK